MTRIFCEICGRHFRTSDPGELYCSDKCRHIVASRRAKALGNLPPEEQKERNREKSRAAGRAKSLTVKCRICGGVRRAKYKHYCLACNEIAEIKTEQYQRAYWKAKRGRRECKSCGRSPVARYKRYCPECKELALKQNLKRKLAKSRKATLDSLRLQHCLVCKSLFVPHYGRKYCSAPCSIVAQLVVEKAWREANKGQISAYHKQYEAMKSRRAK